MATSYTALRLDGERFGGRCKHEHVAAGCIPLRAAQNYNTPQVQDRTYDNS